MKKILVILNIFCFLTACASTSPSANNECKEKLFGLLGETQSHNDCLQKQAQQEKERIHQAKLKINPNYVAEERAARIAAKRPGASIEQHVKIFGEPTTKEIMNGKDVYWYDGDEPYFVVFNNDKLESLMIDRETIDKREASMERQRDRVTAENAARRARIGQALSNIQPVKQEAYQMPVPKRTNCQRTSNGMDCTTY